MRVIYALYMNINIYIYIYIYIIYKFIYIYIYIYTRITLYNLIISMFRVRAGIGGNKAQ